MILKSVIGLDGSLHPIMNLPDGFIHNNVVFSSQLKDPIPVKNIGSINGVKYKTGRVNVDFRAIGLRIDNTINVINPMSKETNCSVLRIYPEENKLNRVDLVNELHKANRENYYEFSLESIASGNSLAELSIPLEYEFCIMIHDYSMYHVDAVKSQGMVNEFGLVFSSKLIHLFMDDSHHSLDDRFESFVYHSVFSLSFRDSNSYAELRRRVDSYFNHRAPISLVINGLKELYKHGTFIDTFIHNNSSLLDHVIDPWTYGRLLVNHNFKEISYHHTTEYNNLSYFDKNNIKKISSMIRFINSITPTKERNVKFDEEAFDNVVPNSRGNLLPFYDKERDVISLKYETYDGHGGPMRFARW